MEFLPQAVRRLQSLSVKYEVFFLEKEAGRIKVTVLKRFDTKEVFKDPPVKAKYSGPCPVFKEGQVFYVDDSMPSGFCPYAWDAIFFAVITLKSNGNFSEWYDEPGVAVGCCGDGLRPVVFKLERK
ncbi:MAG: TIGR04076 family protein [Candidatus Bathyarchaeia archaeon]